jgi:hypothetical protein
MDKQRIFDVTVAFLAGQGRQSISGPTCAYRGDNGARCAIGLWISDAKYTPNMEGSTLTPCFKPTGPAKLIHEAVPFPMTSEIQRFMIDLQLAHDGPNLFGALGWGRLMKIAGDNQLDTTVLNAVWTGRRISE